MSQRSNAIVDINDLKTVIRIISRNWFIPLVAVSVSGLLSYVYTYKLTDIFAAQSQILLKSGETYDYQNKIYQNLGYNNYQSYTDISNEIRVLRSRDLIEQALKRLNFDVSYFIVGRLKTTEVYDKMPYNVEVLYVNPQLFRQQIRFKILSEHEYELEYLKQGNTIKSKGIFNTDLVNTDLKIRVKSTSAINQNTVQSLKEIDYLIQLHDLNSLVSTFQSNLKVDIPEYTNILQVTVEDPLPQRAVAFLDTLSQVYIESSIQSNFKINENTLFFIDKQLEEVTNILSGIEDTMESYKRSEAIMDLTKEQEDYFDKLSELDNQRTRLELNIDALDALEEYIIEDKDPEFLPPSVYVNTDDVFLKENVSALYELQLNKNTVLFRATETSLPIKELDEKIDRIKNNLLTYIGNARQAIKGKIKDVTEKLSGYQSDIRAIPQKQRGLLNIQRKMQVNEKMYLFLLEKRSNTLIAKAGIIPETKIIERAKSIGRVKPNRGKIRSYFILVGGLLGLGIVFIRATFFERIESLDELKQKTKLPILGEILQGVKISEEKDFIITVENDPKSPITESFRTIRTNLQYFAPDSFSKVILVTSNSPGEGKTFCSINIAAILAKAGKKVLVLELDLHKPKVHLGLKMDSDVGITTILIGKAKVDECIQKSRFENLDVILSGPIPPNASELVLSPALHDILNYGRSNYDYVIIDTPPVGLISDAVYMMRFADISLFVINAKVVNKDAINTAEELAQNNNLKHFGFILNGVKRRRSKYYYNKYAYSYGYGYGYGYGYSGASKVQEKKLFK